MALSDIYQKASLVQIPSGYKSGTLYSVVPNTADGDFTVTGDPQGEATRVNKDGLIETVSANVPRLNYDPSSPQDPHLLLEPTRNNFNTNSENFSSGYSTVGSPVSVENNLTSPNGGINAAKQTIATTGNGYYKFPTTVTSGTDYTVSAFFKYISGSGEVVRFGAAGGTFGGDQQNRINIKTGVVEFTNTGNTVVVEEYPNKWYRVSCTKDATSSGSGGFSMFTNADDMVFGWWGVQFEQGSYAASYIPTSGSAVTRSAETCNNAGNSTVFNDTEGTLFVDLENFDVAGGTEVTLSNGFSSNRVVFLFYGTDSIHYRKIRFFVSSGTTQVDSIYTISYTFNQRNKIAFRYKQNDFKAYINGTQVFSDTSGTTPTSLSRFDFANFNGTTGFIEGEIHQAMVFNEALSDAELITLTT